MLLESLHSNPFIKVLRTQNWEPLGVISRMASLDEL